MRILILEDDLDTQAALRDVLSLDHHDIDTVGTLREALHHGHWPSISAILLDRKLPDGDVDSVLPQIRELAPHAAIIIMTGYADFESTVLAMRSGANDYLLKPINPDMLRATLLRIERLLEAEQRAVQAERLAAVGQMMAALTHESRNFLQRIQTNVELLFSEVHDRPLALELAQAIGLATAEMEKLFSHLRSYVGPMQLDREEADLGTIWRATWNNLRKVHSTGPRAQLVERLHGVDLNISVDTFRMEQVFRNLFENALSAGSDAIEVVVDTNAVELHGQPSIQVRISDNGPGIPPAIRDKVFDPFFTTKAKGTGLGMTIIRRILEAHGGTIDLLPTPTGTTFQIRLPRR